MLLIPARLISVAGLADKANSFGSHKFKRWWRKPIAAMGCSPHRWSEATHPPSLKPVPTELEMFMTFNPAINGWAIFSEACQVMAKRLRDVCGLPEREPRWTR
jgi:hypothetical protein